MFTNNAEIVAERTNNWNENKAQIASMLSALRCLYNFAKTHDVKRDAYLEVFFDGYRTRRRFRINAQFIGAFHDFKDEMYDGEMADEPCSRHTIECLKLWDYMVIKFLDK